MSSFTRKSSALSKLRKLARLARTSVRRIAAAVLERVVQVVAAAVGKAASGPPENPPSVFVLRNNDIGDLLVITPLFEALRRRFPAASIVAGVGNWSVDVLANNPHVSEIVPVNAPWFNKYLRSAGPLDRLRYLVSAEARALAEHHFAIGIDVLGSAWGSLLLLRAAIPYRLGIRGFAGGETGVQATVSFDPSEHVGRTALRFAELLGARDLPACRPQLFLAAGEREWGENWWTATAQRNLRQRRVVIAPGGGHPSKLWSVASFATLTAGLARHRDLSLLVLGGPGEEGLVASVAGASSAVRTLASPPALRQVFALLAASDLVICNSSMAMHVAAAFDKPTVVLLGESMYSAGAHQAQWGYPDTCWSLGREPGVRSDVVNPDEALEFVMRRLSETAKQNAKCS